MANKIKIAITEPQLNALTNIVDEFSAMNGGSDDDPERLKWIKLVDRMLKTNGYEREYK